VIDDVVVLTDDDVVIGFDAAMTELDPDVDVVPLHQLGVQKSVVKSNRTGWIKITADRTMNFRLFACDCGREQINFMFH
jgi:hypothetical protein